MKTARLWVPAFGAGLLLAPAPGEEVVFQPKPETSLTKTIEIVGEFALDEMSILVNGQDLGGMIPDISMDMHQASRIEVTDVYQKVADGRPVDLIRTFDVLNGRLTMEVAPSEADIPEMASSSELEGLSVAFHWNDEKGEYERSFHDCDGDEDLLEHLEEDMDLRAFLPDEEVGVDDDWTVELKDLASIVMPGGNLHLQPDGMEADEEGLKVIEELMAGFGDELEEQLEGECRCTFKGVREEDGLRLGEIAIDIEVATTVELSRFLETIIEKGIEESGAGDMIQFNLDAADLSVDYEGSGTLLWDLAAGRVHSFHISGDATLGVDIVVNIEAQGESQDIDASMEFSGSLEQTLTAKE